MLSKQQIRKEIRQKRQSLPPLACEVAGLGVYENLKKYSPFFRANKVACYLANDGEVSLAPVIEALWQRKKMACLPVLFGFGSGPGPGPGPSSSSGFGNRLMHFAPYVSGSPMLDNQYGIPEPDIAIRHQIKPMGLDIVLMPLVAFDQQGNRLGMGGGYYDRSFSFLKRGKSSRRPRLIGVAYDFQEIEKLASDSWDVPLDAVVTESRLIKIS